jgi:WD40 repeat protein
MYDLSISIPV